MRQIFLRKENWFCSIGFVTSLTKKKKKTYIYIYPFVKHSHCGTRDESRRFGPHVTIIEMAYY